MTSATSSSHIPNHMYLLIFMHNKIHCMCVFITVENSDELCDRATELRPIKTRLCGTRFLLCIYTETTNGVLFATGKSHISDD